MGLQYIQGLLRVTRDVIKKKPEEFVDQQAK